MLATLCHETRVWATPECLGFFLFLLQGKRGCTSEAVSKLPIATASDSKRQLPPLETSPPYSREYSLDASATPASESLVSSVNRLQRQNQLSRPFTSPPQTPFSRQHNFELPGVRFFETRGLAA